MENSSVVVYEILPENVQELVKKYSPRGVNLGGPALDSQINEQISRVRREGGRRFILSWLGNKVPRGACILGHILSWTQHGMVTTDKGARIGTYDRLVEFGGESRTEQLMLVFLSPTVEQL